MLAVKKGDAAKSSRYLSGINMILKLNQHLLDSIGLTMKKAMKIIYIITLDTITPCIMDRTAGAI